MSILAKTVFDAGIGAGVNALFQATVSKLPSGASSTYVPFETEGPTLLIQFGFLANYDGKIPAGTLVGFDPSSHSLRFDDNSPTQGVVRWATGSGSGDLAKLDDYFSKSMKRICEIGDSDEIKNEITIIANFAIKGLLELKKTYATMKKSQKKIDDVADFVDKGIKAIKVAVDEGVDHFQDTPLDKAVRENYRRSHDITFLAQTILRLQQDNISIELKSSYIALLSKWVECKLLEFQTIKKHL